MNYVEVSSLHYAVDRRSLLCNEYTNNISYSYHYSHLPSDMSTLQSISDIHYTVLQLQLELRQAQQNNQHLYFEN